MTDSSEKKYFVVADHLSRGSMFLKSTIKWQCTFNKHQWPTKPLAPLPEEVGSFYPELKEHLRCEYSNRGTLRKLTNQDVLWEQRIATFFLNGPTTFTNVNNTFRTILKTGQQSWVDADLSQNMSSFWLVTFDPKFWSTSEAVWADVDFFQILVSF